MTRERRNDANTIGELKREANAAIADVKDHARKMMHRAIDAGRALLKVEKLLKHGEWLPWLKANFNAKPRMAQYCMLLAALVEYMPDMADRVDEFTIMAALDMLRSEYIRRQQARALTAASYTSEWNRLRRAEGSLLQRARDGLGEEHWKLWLSAIALTPERAEEVIEAAEFIPRNGDPVPSPSPGLLDLKLGLPMHPGDDARANIETPRNAQWFRISRKNVQRAINGATHHDGEPT